MNNKELIEQQKIEIRIRETIFDEPAFLRRDIKGYKVVSVCCEAPIMECGRCSQCLDGCDYELKKED